MKIYMKSRLGTYEAYGVFEEGRVTVKKGSKIWLHFSEGFHKSRRVVECRNDPTCVDRFGIVLKDCEFKSPSTAAQFVNGHSTNGYNYWRIDENTRLSDWLKKLKEE